MTIPTIVSFKLETERRGSDHLVLCVDRLITSDNLQSLQASGASEVPDSFKDDSTLQTSDTPSCAIHINEELGEHGLLEEEEEEEAIAAQIQSGECRICQEEDSIKNLETPCACSGSLKFAHRKCVQRWCNEKGDTTCEICHQPYQPGYNAPTQPGYNAPTSSHSEETTIDISDEWTIWDSPLDLHNPQLLAMAAEQHFLEAEYDDYSDASSSGIAFCRSATLILMTLLLLRHAVNITNANDEEEGSAYFSLFLLRAAGFLLPCYLMAWIVSILQLHTQRQEEAALAATEVAFMLQTREHNQGLPYAVSPEAVVATHQDNIC